MIRTINLSTIELLKQNSELSIVNEFPRNDTLHTHPRAIETLEKSFRIVGIICSNNNIVPYISELRFPSMKNRLIK